MMTPLRAAWFCVGVSALGLGALGVVLPLLPTTPFVLLAAFAFSRSSDRWHRWLVTHRVFGPLIENWQRHGAIGRRAKITAVLSMAAVIVLSIVLNAPPVVLGVQAAILLASAAFVLSRPSPPQRDEVEER